MYYSIVLCILYGILFFQGGDIFINFFFNYYILFKVTTPYSPPIPIPLHPPPLQTPLFPFPLPTLLFTAPSHPSMSKPLPPSFPPLLPTPPFPRPLPTPPSPPPLQLSISTDPELKVKKQKKVLIES